MVSVVPSAVDRDCFSQSACPPGVGRGQSASARRGRTRRLTTPSRTDPDPYCRRDLHGLRCVSMRQRARVCVSHMCVWPQLSTRCSCSAIVGQAGPGRQIYSRRRPSLRRYSAHRVRRFLAGVESSLRNVPSPVHNTDFELRPQLPPVDKVDQQKFCFEAQCWSACFPDIVQLTRVFRQSYVAALPHVVAALIAPLDAATPSL